MYAKIAYNCIKLGSVLNKAQNVIYIHNNLLFLTI